MIKKNKKWTRPAKIKITAYDPFDNQFLGSIESWYNPHLASNGHYTLTAKCLIKAGKLFPTIGIRTPKIEVEFIGQYKR